MKKLVTLVSAALFLGLSAGVSATVLHVPSQYPTIQAGIDAAVNGDTVLVADGIYTGFGNRDIDFFGKAVVLMSVNGPEATIIDCEGTQTDPHRGIYFHSGEGVNSVVQGFTIRNGYVQGDGWSDKCGGAIYCGHSSPTISRNIITGNVAYWHGGGIGCLEAFPVIEGNTIVDNTAYIDGGGIFCESSSPLVLLNAIVENTAQRHGGGFECWDSCYPNLIGNTIAFNTAVQMGGGIMCWNKSSAVVENSILWGDSGNLGPEVCMDGLGGACTISIAFSDVEGGSSAIHVDPGCVLYWGEGNIDADPLFVAGPWGDYYLSQPPCQVEESPCVDAGDPASPVPEGTTRTDEEPDNWPADMGYHYPPYVAGSVGTLWVSVTPETTQVPRGENLWFSADVVNLTDTTLTFDAWVDGYDLSGNPVPCNPVLGPVEITLGGNHGLYGVRRHVRIPFGAPYGSPYKLCVRAGEHPDSVWDDDCFEFAIVPPPVE